MQLITVMDQFQFGCDNTNQAHCPSTAICQFICLLAIKIET